MTVKKYNKLRLPLGPFRILWNEYKAYKSIKKQDFDVIIINAMSPFFMKKIKAKKIGISHGGTIGFNPKNLGKGVKARIRKFLDKLVSQRLERRTWNYCDSVIAINKYMIKEYGAYKIPNKKIIQQNSGANFSDIMFKKRKKLDSLIFMGRISPEKGIHLLIRSFSETDVPKLIIAGCVDKKGYFKQIKKMIDNLGLSKRVEIITDFPETQKDKFLKKGDVFVMPSIGYDPTPNAIYEALASGLPVISSNVIGRNEIINKKNGLIFKQNNHSNLKKSINNLLKKDLSKMSKNARESCEKEYNIEFLAKTIEKLIS